MQKLGENYYFSKILKEAENAVFARQKDFKMQASYINNEKKFILFWNPKASCTSLSYWFIANLLNKELTDDEFTERRYQDGIYYKCSEIKNMDDYKHYDKILFIRNPFKRIVSLYYNKFVNYPNVGSLVSYDKLERIGRLIVNEIYRVDDKDISLYEGITFDRLISWIETKHQTSSFDPNLNFHFSSQMKRKYLSLEMISAFGFVYKTDDMIKPIQMLNQRYDFRFSIKNLNASNLKNLEKKYDLSKLLPSQINNFQNISYNDFLTEENMERIYNLYMEDVYAYIRIAQ